MGYQLVIDPPRAAVIREIFEKVIAGRPLEEIAIAFNADNIRAADGAWTGDKIRDVLRRAPVYAGYVIYRPDAMKNDRWRGLLYPGRYHEPILDWDTVLEMLAAQGRECLWKFDSAINQSTAKE
ncbi:MAG: recombinase family protein [Anaerolineae bacterium]|nr:recombinase family protein [Anaerolineae bacterium]